MRRILLLTFVLLFCFAAGQGSVPSIHTIVQNLQKTLAFPQPVAALASETETTTQPAAFRSSDFSPQVKTRQLRCRCTKQDGRRKCKCKNQITKCDCASKDGKKLCKCAGVRPSKRLQCKCTKDENGKKKCSCSRKKKTEQAQKEDESATVCEHKIAKKKKLSKKKKFTKKNKFAKKKKPCKHCAFKAHKCKHHTKKFRKKKCNCGKKNCIHSRNKKFKKAQNKQETPKDAQPQSETVDGATTEEYVEEEIVSDYVPHVHSHDNNDAIQQEQTGGPDPIDDSGLDTFTSQTLDMINSGEFTVKSEPMDTFTMQTKAMVYEEAMSQAADGMGHHVCEHHDHGMTQAVDDTMVVDYNNYETQVTEYLPEFVEAKG